MAPTGRVLPGQHRRPHDRGKMASRFPEGVAPGDRLTLDRAELVQRGSPDQELRVYPLDATRQTWPPVARLPSNQEDPDPIRRRCRACQTLDQVDDLGYPSLGVIDSDQETRCHACQTAQLVAIGIGVEESGYPAVVTLFSAKLCSEPCLSRTTGGDDQGERDACVRGAPVGEAPHLGSPTSGGSLGRRSAVRGDTEPGEQTA